MKILGQLESACIEQLSSDPGTSVQGRIHANTTEGRVKTDDGTNKRALLRNDDKAVIGNSGTANDNIRFHRGAVDVLQHVPGGNSTSEGTLATSLSQVSGRVENYTDAGKPAPGNTGRLAYLTDIDEVKVDDGTSWIYPVKFDSLAPTTTKGDLITRDASTNIRLAAGVNGYVLSANSAQTSGLEWILKSPTTTKGDLIARDASVDTRLPVGTDGQFLKANSTTLTGLEWGSGTANVAVRSVVTTDTATSADDDLILSGASFTETLFTAAGNTGKTLTLVHNGTSLTQVYTIDAFGAQTIGGSATVALYTNGETLKIRSNGTNWYIIDHKTATGWLDLGAMTITGTTSNPTKATTREHDKILMRRSANFATFRYLYSAASATGSTAGSGGYIFALPSTLTIDTTNQAVDTSVAWQFANGTTPAIIAESSVNGQVGSTASITGGKVKAYDSTHVTMWFQNGLASQSFIGTAGFALNSANLTYNFSFTVPISGWLP